MRREGRFLEELVGVGLPSGHELPVGEYQGQYDAWLTGI
jgi:hypothetical protein